MALWSSLSGSGLNAVTEALLTMLPTVCDWMCTTNVKLDDVPAAIAARLQLGTAPAGGTVHVNAGPVFCVNETKVVPNGKLSLKFRNWAAVGPLFATVIE